MLSAYDVADPSPSPFDQRLTEQRAAILRKVRGQLTAKQQVVIEMSLDHDMTLQAIGDELGITEAAVCLIYGRAMIALRKQLQAYGIFKLTDLV